MSFPTKAFFPGQCYIKNKAGRLSTKFVDLSFSFFQEFSVAFDLWQQGH